MDPNEREQYRAAIYGNREAFEMIIRTDSRALFAIAYGILQNREEAEDVTQDALLKAWKTRWRVREPEKLTELGRSNRRSRVGSTIAFRARSAAGASSCCAHPALLRRDGLSHHRKYLGPDQWRAARNSRPRPRVDA